MPFAPAAAQPRRARTVAPETVGAMTFNPQPDAAAAVRAAPIGTTPVTTGRAGVTRIATTPLAPAARRPSRSRSLA